MREVTRAIQGLPVSAALDLLAFTPRKAAGLVDKTLKSAVANAENNADLRADNLRIKEAVVGEGPSFRRFKARARGMASPLVKRTSHIRIVLTDDPAPENGRTERGKKKGGKKAGKKPAPATAGKETAPRAEPSQPGETAPAASAAAEPTESTGSVENEKKEN